MSIQDGAQRNIIASLLLALQFQVFFSITCVQLNLQSGTKVVDTLVSNGCFYQQFHSFIISFYLNAVNPSTPESMLFVVKERLEGL